MPTDFTPVLHQDPRRVEYVGDEDYLSRADFQRSRAVPYGVALIVSSVVIVLAGVRLAYLALVPPPMIGKANGYVFTSEVRVAEGTVADYVTQFRETVETSFRRTERGSVPMLDDFTAPGVRNFIDSQFTQMPGKYPAGFLQTFLSQDDRVNSISLTDGAQVDYRGIWTVRTTDGTNNSIVYLRATFMLGDHTKFNATGWRLTKLQPLREDEYYAPEREAERLQRLGLEGKQHP